MSPLNRIAQLSEELRNAAETVASVSATRADLAAKASQLSDENALLRSQLRDAQEQSRRDSETIARLAKDKLELVETCKNAANVLAALAIGDLSRVRPDSPALSQLRQAISRHA